MALFFYREGRSYPHNWHFASLKETSLITHARLQQKLARINRDPLLTAKAVGLKYVSGAQAGWVRCRDKDCVQYVDADGQFCQDEEVLLRIKKLALPPAWENVWICADEHGHLQATGIDAKGRKQYRYHPEWNNIRSQTKYYRLPQFADALPLIRTRLEADLKKTGFPYKKVLALAVLIMEQTNIRVGNEEYKKLYGSFGLTTLQDKHVKVTGDALKFQFKGKKGVAHTLHLKSRKLARLIQQSRDIPGKELFQYYDGQGNHRSIGSGDVNAYLKEISGMDFTAKDFRTWAGTVTAFNSFRALGPAATATETKSNILKTIDQVALNLGNTRTVCRKYYIHPALLMAYEKGDFFNYLPDETPTAEEKTWLSPEEQLVKNLLTGYAWQ